MTIPAIKKTTSTHKVEYVDGITITVEGANNATTRKPLYIKAKEAQNVTPVVVTPPVVVPIPNSNAIDVFDNVCLVKNALNRNGKQAVNGDFVASIGALKVSSLDTPRTEMMKFTNEYVNIDNENKFYLVSDEMNIPAGSEDWLTGVDLSGFPYEAYMNIYGKYLGEYGGSLRSTNGNTSDAMFQGAKLPKYKPFAVRMQYTKTNTLKLWIDGVYYGEKKTYLTGLNKQFTRFGIGTDTNNAKWFCSSVMQVNRMLSDDEANRVFVELGKVTFDYPIIKNVSIQSTGSLVKATGDYYSPKGIPEDISKRKYRWYSAGYGNAPDVTNNKLVPELNDKHMISSITYGGFWLRPDIECTDVNGLSFNGASGCVYHKVS